MGRHSIPVLRAMNFYAICERKTLWMGDGELIVGERGPRPKAVPTYPELTCHSARGPAHPQLAPEDPVRGGSDECIARLRARRSSRTGAAARMRDQMFAELPQEWHDAYAAGMLHRVHGAARARATRCSTTRSTARACSTSKREIAAGRRGPRFRARPRGARQARAAAGHGHLLRRGDPLRRAPRRAGRDARPRRRATHARRAELLKIADVCRRVPAHAPRDFHEALQSYWFCHLAVITELNGWDSFSPGHLDQHLLPFYQQGLADGTLTRESARELLECFFIKFNNHPAPPKVGVTAAESGTYTDFANINLGGLLRDGSRRLERGHAPPARHHRRDAPAAAEQQHPAVAQDARRVAEARAARHPQGLRLPVDLQRRRGGRGAAPPGQDARGRARRRLPRLRRGRAPSARKPTSSPATSTW